MSVGRRRANNFPSVASKMSAAMPNASLSPPNRPYPSRQNYFTYTAPVSLLGEHLRELYRKVHIGRPERETLAMVHIHYVLQSPPYMASRQLRIAWTTATGTSFSRLHAWYVCMFTIAHRIEIEVGNDGHASAPPPGPPPLRRRRAPALSWSVAALAKIISKVCGALGVGVKVLSDPTIL
jgi:hypothetical protein